MKRKRNRKKGAVGLIAMFMAGFVLLIGFMFGVDLPMKLIQQNQLKDVTENAAKGAVTYLNEEALNEGHIVFNFQESRKSALELIAESYNLDLKPNYLTAGSRPFTDESLKKVRIKDMVVSIVEIQVLPGLEAENNSKEAFQTRQPTPKPEGPGITDILDAINKNPNYLHFDGIAVNIQASYMKTFDFSKFQLGKKTENEANKDLDLSRVSIAQARIQNYKK